MKIMMLKVLFVFLLAVAGWPVYADIQSRNVEYKDGETSLRGYMYWDDELKGKRPAVLVVHEWWGLNDYAKHRARQLAELGYVAFALDMYGKDKVTSHPGQAKNWMKQINDNVDDWVKRAASGLEMLEKEPLVDAKRIAAIGYCFGGATVLQMAYAGLDIDAVVSFHGSLPAPADDQMNNIKARILIAHGNADPFVSAENVDVLTTALDKAGADWELAVFGSARHGFTNPGAASYEMEALEYNPHADQRSWAMMQSLFDDVFAMNRK